MHHHIKLVVKIEDDLKGQLWVITWKAWKLNEN